MTRWLRALAVAPSTLFVLASALVSSLWVSHPAPLFLAVFGLAVYAAALAQGADLRERVRANLKEQLEAATEAPDARAQRFAGLSASQREHFASLEALERKILENYAHMPGGRVLVASSERRLTALLDAFLTMLHALNHHRATLNSAGLAALETEVADLGKQVEREADERLREVKARRRDILTKRLGHFSQVQASRELVSHQLAGIEDVLRLTLEQSVALQAPDAVARQVDELTAQVEATQETVRELERFVALEGEFPARDPSSTRVRS